MKKKFLLITILMIVGAFSSSLYAQNDGTSKVKKIALTDLVLLSTDTEPPEEQYAGTVITDRVLLEGVNTLIFPFETTKDELGATVVLEYKGTSVEEDGLSVNFDEVETLSANVPYVVIMEADAAAPLSFEMKEVVPSEDLTVVDEQGCFDFVGTYIDLPKGNEVVKSGDYVAVEEGFKKAKGGNRIAAYRAYLKDVGSSFSNVSFSFNGDVITGVEAVEIMKNLSGDIYNLNGQKLKNAQKGTNIINGHKVLVK